MKEFNHERIVKYIRAGREANSLCIYMEYMSGGSVKSELDKNGALSEVQAKRYTLQLLEGLSYLHRKYIIHRDIKGSNILCDGEGNIKLADFGVSKQIQTLTSNTNTDMKGTAYWMASEVIQGARYGRKADIWSTGATVVEILTTHPPWHHLAPCPAMFKIASLQKHGYVLNPTISKNAKKFLAKTFTSEAQRPRADELLQHSWLKLACDPESVENIDSDSEDSLTDVQKHECVASPSQSYSYSDDDDSDISDVGEEGYFSHVSRMRHRRHPWNTRHTRRRRIQALFHNTNKVYPMSDPVRGRVMIMNNKCFYKHGRLAETRLGSEIDVDNLTDLFEDLSFEIVKSSSSGLGELKAEIKEETQRPEHHSYGCFFLVLMSRGISGDSGDKFYDVHYQPVDLVKIQDLLSPRNFPAMKEKPKIVILLTNYRNHDGFGDAATAPSFSPAQPVATNQQQKPLGMEQWSNVEEERRGGKPPADFSELDTLDADDFFIIKSATKFYKSLRGKIDGSWFIRILVVTFYRYSCHKDIEELFKIIQDRVRKMSIAYARSRGELIGDSVPDGKCTFTNLRKLYLFPGYPWK